MLHLSIHSKILTFEHKGYSCIILMMKVLFDISPARGFGGVPTYVSLLALNLIQNYPQDVFTLLDYPRVYFTEQLFALDAPNAEIVALHSSAFRLAQHWLFKNRLGRKTAAWLETYPDASFLKGYTNMGRYEIFHLNEYVLFHYPGARLAATVHDLDFFIHPQFHTAENIAFHTQKIKFVKARADGIIAVSKKTADDLMRYAGIHQNKITIIPEGVRPAIQAIPEKECRVVLDRMGIHTSFIFSAATLEPRKNIDELLRVFAKIKKDTKNSDLKLVLAGTRGWLYHRILNLIRAHPNAADIILTGFIDDHTLSCLYSSCLAFLFLSFDEGFGLPPLEAMACGAPVIVTAVGAIPEFAGTRAMYTKPDTTQKTAAYIERLIVDSRYRSQMRRYSFKQAAPFTWERTARETMRFYRTLL